MPPKKTKTKATPSKSAPPAEVPSSVTTNRGKEISTTAAAARSRRGTIAPPVQYSPVSKEAKSKATVARGSKKRDLDTDATDDGHEDEVEERIEPSKKRVRPSTATATKSAEVEKPTASTPKRGRGRSKKEPAAPAVPDEEAGPPFTRHEAPFGGETTIVRKDEDAAAGQLEEEMLETTSKPVEAATRKRKAPTTNDGKATSRGAKKADVATDKAIDAAKASATPMGKSFWLMKAEQEDRLETTKGGEVINTRFTIADLRSKLVPEPWDGVRNYVAAKNMRAMRRGDLAFFYASGGKSGRKPGITGIIEIVGEAIPDITAYDENAYGYVEKLSDRDKWVVVHVEHRKTLSQPVYLSELQKYKRGLLEDMELHKSSRLSVSGVKEEEWGFIVNELITGYADDEAADDMALNVQEDEENEKLNPDSEMSDRDVVPATQMSLDAKSNNLARSPRAVLQSIETSSSKPAGEKSSAPATTSRRTSRAASRQTSQAPSVGLIESSEADLGVNSSSGVTTRRSSRAASLAPVINGDEEETKTSERGTSRASTRYASRAPSAGFPNNGLLPGQSTRGGSRGRSRTPKVNSGTATGTAHERGNLTSVMEE